MISASGRSRTKSYERKHNAMSTARSTGLGTAATQERRAKPFVGLSAETSEFEPARSSQLLKSEFE
jgi:hypothetical protein